MILVLYDATTSNKLDSAVIKTGIPEKAANDARGIKCLEYCGKISESEPCFFYSRSGK